MLSLKVEQKKTAYKAGMELSRLLKVYEDKPILLMFSGGSALSLLPFIKKRYLGSHITVTVLDERHSSEAEDSNFLSFFNNPLTERFKDTNVHFIEASTKSGETLEEHASRFEGTLRHWKEENPTGLVIATMGIGEDGHTAGIMGFAGQEDEFNKLFESENWVVGYDAGERSRFALRVSVTNTFLRSTVAEAVVFAVGENKREALKKTLAKDGIIAESPARIIQEMKNVIIFTDQKI